MLMLKTFQYRLYPTKEQQRLLDRQVEECRWLWNTLLAERKQAWEERREMVGYFEQKGELPGVERHHRPSPPEGPPPGLQDVVVPLQKAVDALFRRPKTGAKTGRGT